MADWIQALFFNTGATARLSQRRYVFAQGFLVIVIVSLLLGLPAFITQIVNRVEAQQNAQAEMADFTAQFEEGLDRVILKPADYSVPVRLWFR